MPTTRRSHYPLSKTSSQKPVRASVRGKGKALASQMPTTRPRAAALRPRITPTSSSRPTQQTEPEQPSSPSPSLKFTFPAYRINMRYLLRVNGSKVLEHIAFHDRQLILMEDIEDRAKYLLARPESGINGREFKWMSRTIKYRVDHPQDTWQYCALEDFSDAEGMRLFDGMDRHVKRYSDVTKLNFRIELRVQIDSTQKASPENQVANELSGPRLADTTLPGNTCPNNAASIPDWGWIQQALQRIENKLTVDPSTPRGRKRRNSALSRSDYDEEEAEFEEHRRRINSRRYRNQLEDDLEDLEEAQRAVHRNRMDRLHLQNLRINRQIALELAPMHVPMFMPPAQQYQAR